MTLGSFRNFIAATLPVSFGRDMKSRWSLLPVVHVRESKISHTGGKWVTFRGFYLVNNAYMMLIKNSVKVKVYFTLASQGLRISLLSSLSYCHQLHSCPSEYFPFRLAFHVIMSDQAVCPFVCLSVHVTQKLLLRLTWFLHKSIIPMALTSSKMIRIGIWTQEFLKGSFTIGKQNMPSKYDMASTCIMMKTCAMKSHVRHSERGYAISDCLVVLHSYIVGLTTNYSFLYPKLGINLSDHTRLRQNLPTEYSAWTSHLYSRQVTTQYKFLIKQQWKKQTAAHSKIWDRFTPVWLACYSPNSRICHVETITRQPLQMVHRACNCWCFFNNQ